jgi:hypothetical protein
VFAHDGRSMLREVELWGQIHEMTLPKQRHPKVPCLSFPLNKNNFVDNLIYQFNRPSQCAYSTCLQRTWHRVFCKNQFP